MSKKCKTQHQNYQYHVEMLDTFDYESRAYAVTDVFDTESEAVIAAHEYADSNELDKDPFADLHIVNSVGRYYTLRRQIR